MKQSLVVIVVLILVRSCLPTDVNAQVYPLQTTIALTPPYSGNLSDYTVAGSRAMTINISANDLAINNYPVRLRLTIDGLGITVRSKQNFTVDPIYIDAGAPLSISGDDLREYFSLANLDFVGFSKTEYQRTGKLPEGVYRFSIEVLDYNRGSVVSNKGSATAWIVLNSPPLLNLPATSTKIRLTDPTNIPFTWTPRHTGSPNSAFTTEYVFRLVEIWPANRNPNDAFLAQAPLYEIETSQSQIVYGVTEPALIPGRKYAWQVQARDTEGRDLFRNSGKSEVFVFQFGDAIEMPQNVRKETANANTISIRWEPSANGEIPAQYRIRYRAEGTVTWFEDVTTQYWHTLTGLQQNKAYDIEVRAESGRQVSEYTLTQRHNTTLPLVDENFQCGNPFNIQVPVMTTPLPYMNPGDVLTCADFEVTVTSVKPEASTPGAFSGTGYAKVLMFNRANIEVTFSGTFNKEYQLVTGSFQTTYQKGSKIDRLTEEMKNIGKEQPITSKDSAAQNPESTLIIVNATIDSVYTNEAGKIIVTDVDGKAYTYDQKKNSNGEKQEMIVEDKNGEKWVVDKDGKSFHVLNPNHLTSFENNLFKKLQEILMMAHDSLKTKQALRRSKLEGLKILAIDAGLPLEHVLGKNEEFVSLGFSNSFDIYNYSTDLKVVMTDKEQEFELYFQELYVFDKNHWRVLKIELAVKELLTIHPKFISFSHKFQSDKNITYEDIWNTIINEL